MTIGIHAMTCAAGCLNVNQGPMTTAPRAVAAVGLPDGSSRGVNSHTDLSTGRNGNSKYWSFGLWVSRSTGAIAGCLPLSFQLVPRCMGETAHMKRMGGIFRKMPLDRPHHLGLVYKMLRARWRRNLIPIIGQTQPRVYVMKNQLMIAAVRKALAIMLPAAAGAIGLWLAAYSPAVHHALCFGNV